MQQYADGCMTERLAHDGLNWIELHAITWTMQSNYLFKCSQLISTNYLYSMNISIETHNNTYDDMNASIGMFDDMYLSIIA